MLYCIVLYCIVLYCTVLYCIVLFCTSLHCIASYRIVSYRIVSYRIVSYCIVLYCTLVSSRFNILVRLDSALTPCCAHRVDVVHCRMISMKDALIYMMYAGDISTVADYRDGLQRSMDVRVHLNISADEHLTAGTEDPWTT